MSTPRRGPSGRPLVSLLLVVGVVVAMLGAPSAGAAAADRHSATSPRQVRAERALSEARALLTGQAGAGQVTAHGRDATLVLRDLIRLRDALSPRDRAEAARLLARPTDGPADPVGDGYDPGTTPRVVCDVVCVHWVDTSGDAVDQTDSDADTIPDYVETTLATMGSVHKTYVKAGYRAPKGDGTLGGTAQADIYLVNVGPQGLYGYCTSDQVIPNQGPYDAWAYCVLDNDYASNEFPTNTPVENLQVTAAHEYFHAVQFAYDAYEDGWFMEATATWAEDELFDGVDDNVQYLKYGPLGEPRIPLDTYAGLHHYGDWIFFRFLTERFKKAHHGLPTLVRSMWRQADGSAGAKDLYSIQAVKKVLATRGTSFPKAFAQFADANRRPAKSYSEGAANDYPVPDLWGSATLSPQHPKTTWAKPKLDHQTSATARFTPSGTLKRLRIQVDLAPKKQGSAAVVTVHKSGGGTRTTTVKLNRKGDGARTFPFATRKVKYVELTVVNASSRFKCWQGSPFSCQGAPRDDTVTERFRGVASR